jgi:uncharacterized protein (DUF849 family)
MIRMRSLLPATATWFAFGVSRHQFPMVAQAALLGGHPRVGLEDNIYLEKGKLAASNAAWSRKRGAPAAPARGPRRPRRARTGAGSLRSRRPAGAAAALYSASTCVQ